MVDHLDPSARAHDPAPPRRFLTPTTAGVVAGVTRFTIVRWCRDGLLPGRKIVGRWRIDPQDLDRLLGEEDAA